MSGEEGDLTTMERLAHAMIRRKPATGEEMEGRKDRSTHHREERKYKSLTSGCHVGTRKK